MQARVARSRAAPQRGSGDSVARLGFNLYLLFTTSWFLHLPARIPALGALRMDFLLAVILAVLAYVCSQQHAGESNQVSKWLRILVIYAIGSVPFVEWPGSVMKFGLQEFIKAAVFFYFTVAFIRSENDLRKFMILFIGCQTFRVLEPLFLHITIGYWGSGASMEGGSEFLARLSGAPHDVVNPNGLAFVACTIIPFLYFTSNLSWQNKVAFFAITPASLYALSLTGSRSGIIAIVIVAAGIVLKSKKPIALGIAVGLMGIASIPFMSSDMQDRYLSIIGMGEKNVATAGERSEGMRAQLQVAMRRPFFGHGLGTSAEANSNYTSFGPYVGKRLPAHNLYIEVAQELGFIGLVLFSIFMVKVVVEFIRSRNILRGAAPDNMLARLHDSLQVWLAMNLVFSLASYGLRSYDWYLFAGLSVVLNRLAKAQTSSAVQPEGQPASRGARRSFRRLATPTK
jgi:putative inorganic carbon (hco3(-)) transporter